MTYTRANHLKGSPGENRKRIAKKREMIMIIICLLAFAAMLLFVDYGNYLLKNGPVHYETVVVKGIRKRAKHTGYSLDYYSITTHSKGGMIAPKKYYYGDTLSLKVSDKWPFFKKIE